MSTLDVEKNMPASGHMSLKLIRISRLKQFFAKQGLEELADRSKAIGKKVNQTSDLVTGKASFGEKVARSIEENAGLPAGWLDSLGDDQNTAVGPIVHGQVPLISNVQAGMYKEFIDNLLQSGDGKYERISTTVPIRRHTFALRVTGDSMEPKFTDGMILVVEPDMEPNPGDYVIAKNGSDETTFKQLIKDGADWFLKPLNDRYPIKPLGESTIIGVVRSVELRLR
jgi:SOS-response transcriptional repressor LexA